MNNKTFSEVTKRTLDYLSGKHPWFGAVMRNRKVAMSLLVGYVYLVVMLAFEVHGGTDDGWTELVKSYSPLFFDVLVVFLVSAVFLVFRGYYAEENSRIDVSVNPQERFFIPIRVDDVQIGVDDSDVFQRHAVVSSILDAIPIDQSDFFWRMRAHLTFQSWC